MIRKIRNLTRPAMFYPKIKKKIIFQKDNEALYFIFILLCDVILMQTFHQIFFTLMSPESNSLF